MAILMKRILKNMANSNEPKRRETRGKASMKHVKDFEPKDLMGTWTVFIPRNRLQSRSLQHYHQDASNKDAYDKDDDEDTFDYPSDKDASASHVAMLNIGYLYLVIYARKFIIVLTTKYGRFSQVHEFKKPNDEKALNLMNSCAVSMCKELPHIMLAYGFGNEYSFIFRPETDHYNRRASKLVSVIVSLFTSSYRMKWTEFFPNKDMRSGAFFEGEVLCLKRTSDIQAYLAFKQRECYENNLTNTCFWKLVASGKSEQERTRCWRCESEKGKGKNEILFQQLGINYNDLPDMFRQGSCILKTVVDDRRQIIVVHAENIASRAFLNSHSILFKELTGLDENASIIGERQLNLWRVENDKKQELVESDKKQEQVENDKKQEQVENDKKQDHWIVVRIDGCRFSRSCEVNEFEKTNDETALNLMNSCALSTCKELPDIILAYGFGHEYSTYLYVAMQFHLKESKNDHARLLKLVSVIDSLFTSSYQMKWIKFFPNKDMRSGVSFEGEVMCLKTTSDIQAYLALKQQECENAFKQQLGINYNDNDLPDMFRQGSCILKTLDDDRQKLIVVHAENIASRAFLNGYSIVLSTELTGLDENALTIGGEHLNLWRVENRMKQDGWIVVRIDGCRFSRFTKVHEFKKPFDQQAAELMNSCAMAVFEEFKDIIVYGYGQSDEYSFVLEKNTQLYQGRASKLVSAVCSVFNKILCDEVERLLPEKELESHEHTGREVMRERFQTLSQEFGIEYNQLPLMFRNGSSIFWDDKEINGVKKLVVEYPDVIRDGFWEEHAHIL
ncbi:tRNA(His) guanylyltransferase 1-like protein isoform X1 [Tanacetum coccineum]